MTTIETRHRFLSLCIVFSLTSLQNLWAQNIPELEPASAAYNSIKEKGSLPVKERKALDTIQYPWAEYSKGAIGNALWRTVYLSPQDEAKLPGIIKFPANSSHQTRAELDYLLELQRTRSKKEIERAEYIANIGSWPNIMNPTDPDYTENMQNLYYIVSTATGNSYN